MPVMVSAEDFATHLDTTVKREQAEQVLDLVEAVVLTEYGSDTPPTGSPLLLLRTVVLSVATRAYTNPAGLQSETIGPYTYRRSDAGISLTQDERTLIRNARGGSVGGVISVPLTTPADAARLEPDLWWPW